jgi:hypothetical protein
MERQGQPPTAPQDLAGRLTEREAACVRLAHEKRIDLLEANLREASPIRFENPLTETARIQWRDTTRGRVFQVLMSPVVAIITIVLVLLAPLSYLDDHRSRWKERRQMRAEIARLRNGDGPLPGTEYRTVEALWHACDIPEMGLSHEAELELLGQWVEMLYDRETRESLDLVGRVVRIQAERAAAAKKRSKDILVTYMPVMSVIVRDLSAELPPYA